ncbi:radical SAM protein [Ferrimonas balearica]|uniref:radical SAM protein n=1 Tax=Ferrimonas balearica TaxID=44012 RepID=UPI001C577298|nr:radical SAM protein [Ferrimonas balearica]MBW3164599.1 radical SAM protein [Ferrimonas balearica]
MAATFKYPRDYPTRFVALVRCWFWLKGKLRFLRVQKPVTAILGAQYRPSRELIEIDITYQCNLRCLNCNRSCTQAPDDVHMPLPMITQFVDDSLARSRNWLRIRVLGGEPTLHPEFHAIVDELLRYKAAYPECKVEVVTNGYGRRVERELEKLPDSVCLDNSNKDSVIQPEFGPFNRAPVDQLKYQFTDFSNACAIVRDCGVGLTPQGYYPCAVAGGIDRVLGVKTGRQSLPSLGDDMTDLSKDACRLCGRYEDGHYVPNKLRPRLETEVISPTWDALYDQWRKQQDRGNSK